MFDGKVKLEPKLWGASKNKGVMYTAQQHTILEVLYEYIYQVNEQLYKFCVAALHWGYELGRWRPHPYQTQNGNFPRSHLES